MSTTILGYRLSAPIMVAPTAMHQFAHPEGLSVFHKDLLPIFIFLFFLTSITVQQGRLQQPEQQQHVTP